VTQPSTRQLKVRARGLKNAVSLLCTSAAPCCDLRSVCCAINQMHSRYLKRWRLGLMRDKVVFIYVIGKLYHQGIRQEYKLLKGGVSRCVRMPRNCFGPVACAPWLVSSSWPLYVPCAWWMPLGWRACSLKEIGA
jgi:hypothetical protein